MYSVCIMITICDSTCEKGPIPKKHNCTVEAVFGQNTKKSSFNLFLFF